jgi:hypothetical protein
MECKIGSITVVDSCTADHDNNSLTIQSHTEMTNFNKVCDFLHGDTLPVLINSYLEGGAHYTRNEGTISSKEGSVQKYTQVMTDMIWGTVPVQVKASTLFSDNVSYSTTNDFFTCPMTCTFENVSIEIYEETIDFGEQDYSGALYHTLQYQLTGNFSDWCGDFIGKIDVKHSNMDQNS